MTLHEPGAFDAHVLGARVSFIPRRFRIPLVLSSGPIAEITEAVAEVRVRVGGREAVGHGSIYLSDLWAWPDPQVSHVRRDGTMRALCGLIAEGLPNLCGDEAQHPLELGMRLHAAVMGMGVGSAGAESAAGWDNPNESSEGSAIEKVPALARSVCLSPFDAAIHDAVGQALWISAFRFYDDPATLPEADAWFPGGGAVAAVAAALRSPVPALTAWLVIGASGPPEAELAPWIRERGYHAFKLKLSGTDNKADVARTIAVYRGARDLGQARPRLCIDSNCANPDADSVRDYLERLSVEDPEAYAVLEYVEQPTGRDISSNRYDWRQVTAMKPVLLDEGLIGPEQMETAAQQGWSGFAVKTCKGHSFSLLAAAWACQRRMSIAQQDLTNPGLAAIHSFLCAAHLPVINGIELNSLQFTPDANRDWLPRLGSIFEPRDGFHRLFGAVPAGLGSTL